MISQKRKYHRLRSTDSSLFSQNKWSKQHSPEKFSFSVSLFQTYVFIKYEFDQYLIRIGLSNQKINIVGQCRLLFWLQM